MDSFETLQEFENFYDAMLPAQEKSPQIFAWFSGIPHPLFNAIMHLSCDQQLEERVESLIQRAPQGIPLSFWLHPQNQAEGLVEVLHAQGFHSLITCPLMAWSTQAHTSSSCNIRPVKNEIFYDIIATTFHFDQAVKQGFAQLMKKTEAENYLIYMDDKPIGTGTLFSHGKTGGIFNIAILPYYQNQGCEKRMMQFLMKRAYDLEVEKLILLSAPPTEKFYSTLGFTKCFDIEMYAR